MTKIINTKDMKKRQDWKHVEFFAPITEGIFEDDNSFTIRGKAINETTTRNGVTYVASELDASAHTFRDKPILLDHKNEVKNIVGRTTENVVYSSADQAILYEAKIMDKEIQQMIKDGRITNVSIGAAIKDLVEDEEAGTMTAVGMEGLEISLVAVPGDPGANIATALQNSFKLKEAYEREDLDLDKADDEDWEDPEDKKVINVEGCKGGSKGGKKKLFEIDIDGQKITGKGEVKVIFN